MREQMGALFLQGKREEMETEMERFPYVEILTVVICDFFFFFLSWSGHREPGYVVTHYSGYAWEVS